MAAQDDRLSRLLTVAVLVVAVVMIALAGLRSLQILRQLSSAQLEVSDNLTWVNAQVEVDYLKLFNAVLAADSRTPADPAAPVAPGDWQLVIRQFDIYYSRIEATLDRTRTLVRKSPDWQDNLDRIEGLVAGSRRMATRLDATAAPRRADLDALRSWLADEGEAVRSYSVEALNVLTRQASTDRQSYVRAFRQHLALSASTMIVLAFIGLATYVLFRQVEKRAGAERDLRQSLARLIDAEPDGVILTDAAHRILRLNAGAVRLLGCDDTWVLGRDAIGLFFPTAGRLARRGRPHPAVDGLSAGPFRDIARTWAGRRFPVKVSRAVLMPGTNGGQIALYIRDISETQAAMRALRRERRRAEAEAARYWRFLSVMSHEIRTPLHGIVAALDLVRAREVGPETAELVEIAWNAAQVALDQADEVLEIGRIEHEMTAVSPSPFRPADVLRDLADMMGPLTQHGRIALRLDIAPLAETAVLGVRGAFWHAVSNLLSNALKFTRQGSVTLRLFPTDAAARELRLEVSDTGTGIAPELQAAIFRDHFTSGPRADFGGKGAGLGLGVFRRAVAMMGGEFGLHSMVGEGSTFWFTFPAPVAEPPPPDLPAVATALPRIDLRVLVVDDVQVNRTLMLHMLEKLGARAEAAASGAEAVARARTAPFDVILMDLAMPGMTGYAAAREIRRAGAAFAGRILALTANAFALNDPGADCEAFDDVLLKPIKLAELTRVLAAAGPAAGEPATAAPGPVLDDEVLADLMTVASSLPLADLVAALLADATALADQMGATGADLPGQFHNIAGAAAMLGAARLRMLALAGENAAWLHGTLPDPGFAARWQAAITATRSAYADVLAARDAPG